MPFSGEDRPHDVDVGGVDPAVEGVVHDVDVAGPELVAVPVEERPHRRRDRAEVERDRHRLRDRALYYQAIYAAPFRDRLLISRDNGK